MPQTMQYGLRDNPRARTNRPDAMCPTSYALDNVPASPRWARLTTPRLPALADSLPPFGTPEIEADYVAHLELLERLEVRAELDEAGLL